MKSIARYTLLLLLLLTLAACGGQIPANMTVVKPTSSPVSTEAEATDTPVAEATNTPAPIDETLVPTATDGEGEPSTTGNEETSPTPTYTPLPKLSSEEAYAAVVALETSLQEIYKRVNPSVVNIQVMIKEEQFQGFFAPKNEDESFSYANGSGFIWDEEGHIVTNSHVVADVDRIIVTFADGHTVDAELVGEDTDSDLAVIKVDVPQVLLRPIEVRDSTDVEVGEMAIAIGNPFGLEGTMTVGFISALGRSIPVFSQKLDAYYSIPDIIQSDAPINPGNSGGVLVDNQGRLIGVTSAIQSPVRASAGIGFSVPSAIVKQVIPVLIDQGMFEHPWLGVSGTTLTPDIARKMGLDLTVRGALVIEVISDGPSDKAGLMGSGREVSIDGQDRRIGGDVIIAFDGRPVEKFEDIVAYLARYTNVGDTVTLTILRDGEEQTIDVELGLRPSSNAMQEDEEDTIPTPEPVSVWLGIDGQTLTADLASAMNLPRSQEGVLISSVENGSPAAAANLRGSFKSIQLDGETLRIGGDVLIAADDTPLDSVEDLEDMLTDAEPDQEITFTILRNGDEQEVLVTLQATERK